MSTRLRRAARENNASALSPKARRNRATQVLALARDYLELRRSAKIHHDARPAVTLEWRDAIGEPISAKFSRIVDQHRHSSLDARLNKQGLEVKIRLAHLPQR